MLNALHVSSHKATWKINAFLLNCMNMSSFLEQTANELYNTYACL